MIIGMIIVTLLMGVLSGKNPGEIISLFNSGWGFAVGEFALILLPSFVLAATISRQKVVAPAAISVGLAPIAGAGMVCPDTAYAALSPMVERKKLSVAFGSYAGFKLLFPAGPLIIATSLGVADGSLLFYCILVFIPVWVIGLLYSRAIEVRFISECSESTPPISLSSLIIFWPFGLLAVLLVAGVVLDMSFNIGLDLATNPKGALFITAAASLSMVAPQERKECIESGVSRTGSLLLVIGAASAFSAFLTDIVPVEEFFLARGGVETLCALFSLTAVFKLLQGSSMSTFAAIGPVAVPIVAASEVSPVLAVLSICLGSFLAILPNDSYYWLIRNGALNHLSDFRATSILVIGASLQAFTGMGVLLFFYMIKIV